MRVGTGRVRTQKRHLCCHTHLSTSGPWSWSQCASLGCENRSEGRGSTKCDTQKYKCQFHHSIRKPVTLFPLFLRPSGQFYYNFAPIRKKNVGSTMFSSTFHKEVILGPLLQWITVQKMEKGMDSGGFFVFMCEKFQGSTKIVLPLSSCVYITNPKD
jgi:hypothetical protein